MHRGVELLPGEGRWGGCRNLLRTVAGSCWAIHCGGCGWHRGRRRRRHCETGCIRQAADFQSAATSRRSSVPRPARRGPYAPAVLPCSALLASQIGGSYDGRRRSSGRGTRQPPDHLPLRNRAGGRSGGRGLCTSRVLCDPTFLAIAATVAGYAYRHAACLEQQRFLPESWRQSFRCRAGTSDGYTTVMLGLTVPVSIQTHLSWDYTTAHPRIQRLYDEARQLQWDEIKDIDWTCQSEAAESDPSAFGRAAFNESFLAAYGESMWRHFRRQQQSWMVSQFLHGEQAALVVSARLAEVLPDVALKGYAASQAAEEARHVAVFLRYANERLSERYAVSPSFELLLEQILRDSQWDVLALGMHVMVEALALAAFRLANSTFEDPLIRRITHLTARDEARHVSFGVLLLDGLYTRMSASERSE